MSIKRRQRKDFEAFKRVIVNVTLLLILGIPGVIVTLMSLINGVMHPLAYRIFFFGIELGLVVLSIEMLVMTPQLRNILLKKWRQNRVTPFTTNIQMRSMEKTE